MDTDTAQGDMGYCVIGVRFRENNKGERKKKIGGKRGR